MKSESLPVDSPALSIRSLTPTTPSDGPASPISPASSHTDVDSGFLSFRHVFLPTGHWADVRALRAVEGAIIALIVRYAGDESHVEDRSLFVQRALGSAREAGLWDVWGKRWGKEWEDFDGKQMPFFVSKGEGDDSYDIMDVCTGDGEDSEPITTTAAVMRAFALASLRSILSISSHCGRYALHILERPPITFQPSRGSLIVPASLAQNEGKDEGGYVVDDSPYGIPSPSEWRELWAAWDQVTLGMIPKEMLLQKPINLRHICLFYTGHIPTFLDMLLSKAIGGPATEPKYFWDIFERGIDPHVGDPDNCHHSHSNVPVADEDWPSLATVLAFRDRVRARLMRLYDELLNGERGVTRNIARTLVMTLEHEGFHVETLLYMLIQRAGTGTHPPLGFTPPPWTSFVTQWDMAPEPTLPLPSFGPTTIVLGHEDSEVDDFGALSREVRGHMFGWDNESPPRALVVGPFRAEWRPVTNGEYLKFWEAGGRKMELPKSWIEEGGEIKVRTLYGPVAMAVAQHWPVLTSYDDLAEYARLKGGRIPTEPELRLFLDTYEVGHQGGANVGFRNWHPIPATMGLAENSGRGSNGGVWEWTSTLFESQEGLVPTSLFTGYSVDFFDDKHQVVLGASYATIPRLASRRTLRNFYQHNYPYAWVGARVVYDLWS